MKSLFRSIAMSPTVTQVIDGKEIDFSFITPQLGVCSGPVDCQFRSWYRLLISDLSKWLDTQSSNWHIWNLRGEGAGYDLETMRDKVSFHPLTDHEAPSMDMLLRVVKELDEYLSETDHLAVVHCKAGRGRSGTVVCAYLMYQFSKEGKHLTVEEAILWFSAKRMRTFADTGISIKSQRRALEYWYKFLQFTRKERLEYFRSSAGAEKHLYGIRVINPCQGWIGEICIQTYIDGNIGDIYKFTDPSSPGISRVRERTPIPVQEFRVAIKWCYCWYHLFFEKRKQMVEGLDTFKLVATWDDFDGFKGTTHKGVKWFDALEIYW
ncbi:phosphatases II, partial [Suhomyces tanzawaensis NRRL Y-17324]